MDNMIGTCQRCGRRLVQTFTLRHECPEFCRFTDAFVVQCAREAQALWEIERRHATTASHTTRLNAEFGLYEDRWPNHQYRTDYSLLMVAGNLADADTSRYDAAQRHVHEREVMAVFWEIERRGLWASPPQTTLKVFPWEVLHQTDVRFEPGPDTSGWIRDQVYLDRLASGGHGGYGNVPGRARKVGFNNTPDEENMGLYRREPGEH